MDKHAIKYFWQVLRRFKAQLGGASALVVLAGIVEHYIQASVHWNVYAWIIAACLFVALFVEGLDSYTKLLPILKISQNVLPQEWVAPGGTRCRAYYLEVFNASAARTIQHVSVQLVSIEPDVQNLNWLPVNLHLKHDNNPGIAGFQYQIEFALNPGGLKQVDLVSASNNSPSITVEHIVAGVNKFMPAGTYRMTVVATGQDVRPATCVYEVSCDVPGRLQCVSLG